MTPQSSHLVLVPSYNPGNLLLATVDGALEKWPHVWVVVDGSTDDSHQPLVNAPRPGLRVIVRHANSGKGAAVLEGAAAAAADGFTHVLVMDADGQHPAGRIREFMEASMAEPESLICGKPLFGPEAPVVRLYGRRLSSRMVFLENRGRGAADPLFGFRVYPIAELRGALEAGRRRGRRYTFDPEAAVRLAWAGVRARNLEAECAYLPAAKGGVSHFRYVRDNLKMVAMHSRLILELLLGRGGKETL
jgi:glycosyltransferase involved in cell wall biosynthesis